MAQDDLADLKFPAAPGVRCGRCPASRRCRSLPRPGPGRRPGGRQHGPGQLRPGEPGPFPGRRPPPARPGQHRRIDPGQHPPRRRGRCHRPMQLRLVAQRLQIGDPLGAVGDRCRQITQHLVRIMPTRRRRNGSAASPNPALNPNWCTTPPSSTVPACDTTPPATHRDHASRFCESRPTPSVSTDTTRPPWKTSGKCWASRSVMLCHFGSKAEILHEIVAPCSSNWTRSSTRPNTTGQPDRASSARSSPPG